MTVEPERDRKLLSIVVPVYNEEASVLIFVDALCPVFDGLDLDFEIVFVDDGSHDETLALIKKIHAGRARIRTVVLSRNFGKEIALSAGLDYARGDAVIPMDVDLQDPPDLIPAFVEKWQAGYDVVYGARVSRKHDSLAKRTTAAWFYKTFNRVSDVHIPENVGDFRLMDRRVVDVIRQLPERTRFMKGLFAWVGFRGIGIPYERPARAQGSSKWNRWRLWNLAIEGITSFSTAPLRVWTYVGAFIAFISFVYGSFILIRTIVYGVDMPGYASLMTTVLLLGGVQLLSIGVIGEYLGRIFLEVKGRPVYVVDTVISSDE